MMKEIFSMVATMPLRLFMPPFAAFCIILGSGCWATVASSSTSARASTLAKQLPQVGLTGYLE